MSQILLSLIKNSTQSGVNPFIKVLLSTGDNPDTIDPDLGNISILMIAISILNLELVKTLIKYGADVNFENRVLSRCMFDNFIDAFKLILNQEQINKESIEFALFASLLKEDRIAFTELLLKNKKEICLNSLNTQNLSPLGFAIKVNNNSAINLLEKIIK